MTEFIFIRHGETVANASHTLQGQTESPLNDVGIKQAELASEALKSESFDIVLCSDLERAMETAKIILKNHPGVEVKFFRELREWDLGEYVGKTLEQIPGGKGAFGKHYEDTKIPGGESRFEFFERVKAFFEFAALKYSGKKILIVSHGGVLRQSFQFICGPIAHENIFPLTSNASISRFEYFEEKGSWRLVLWNSTEHLRAMKKSLLGGEVL